ncbi:MAG: 50S ribosomal protein L3 [Patescibacteria group bacterium]|jgi:large subunit ribosomal protein L3|nr:50S ribosomal protein L3 [Patescibacteria group bacterium]
MKFILGKKVKMSQEFKEDGQVIPVTIIEAGPCQVTQIKSQEPDGYIGVQLGFDNKKKINKTLQGHLKDLPNFRYLKEFRLNKIDHDFKRGDEIKVNIFNLGDVVQTTGVSKGKGFQGVVKRHGFKGHPATHGHKDQLRMPGSIGATNAARVFKGTRMAGRMGGEQVTVKNLKVVKIDLDKNWLYLKGAVPGANGGLILIKSLKEVKGDD